MQASVENVNNKKTENIKKSLEKESEFGSKIDLEMYSIPEETIEVQKLDDLNPEIKDMIKKVGITPDTSDKSGSFMMYNANVSHKSAYSDSFELMSTKDAIKKYDGLSEYAWNLVHPEKDKYTASDYLNKSDGYFIRVFKGQKVVNPIQACMMIGMDDSVQYVHNIIVLEEGSELNLLTGCITHDDIQRALHVGITEIYIKKNAKLTYSMIHNWGDTVDVRPRTSIKIEEGGQLVNNYVCLTPAKSVQTNPVTYLEGPNASAFFNTVAVAYKGSVLDLGSRVYLNSPHTKTEIISRTITLGGEVISRGDIIANAENVYGHLECNGLVLDPSGIQKAIPALESHAMDIELTHEASVGRVARDQVEYLMARGLSEEQAVGLIVRGFLSGGIEGIPEELSKEINDIVEKTKDAS